MKSFFGSDYIPPNQFDGYDWLLPKRPSHAPTWFYWTTRRAKAPTRFVDLKTVDPYLQPIVSLANEHGVKTYPSCQGHFYSTGEIQDQAHWLNREVRDLRLGRLQLTNVETGEIVQPYLPTWFWNKQGMNKMKDWEGVGRVGFYFEHPDEAECMAWLGGRGINVEVTGKKVNILVNASHEKGLEENWRKVEDALRQVL